MTDHTVHIEKNGNKGRAYIGSANEPAAEMTFSIAGPSLIIIDHTEVHDHHRGNGLGRKLLDAVVEMARKENIRIIPLCPYANSEFRKDPSIRDVLS
jgi:predicted GNAT family acetyltransferase